MISDDYIMGFVEGEGCFSITIQKEIDRKPRKGNRRAKWKKPALGIRVKPTFRITAVEDEKGILYEIKEKFGFGEVYTQKRTGNSKNASHYYVQSMKDLEEAVKFFKGREFHTSKGHSFRLWLECLEIIKSKGHLTREGLLRICELRDQMNLRIGGKKARDVKLIAKILELQPSHIEAHAKQTHILHNTIPIGFEKWYEKRRGKHELEQIK